MFYDINESMVTCMLFDLWVVCLIMSSTVGSFFGWLVLLLNTTKDTKSPFKRLWEHSKSMLGQNITTCTAICNHFAFMGKNIGINSVIYIFFSKNIAMVRDANDYSVKSS